MLHLLQTAVNPVLGLAESIEKWPEISEQLREAPRKRRLQVDGLGEIGEFGAPLLS